MKLSTVVIGTTGYVLGARAGRDRYEQIVRVARRIAGSQTVQSTAGVLQAQLDGLVAHARGVVAAKIGGGTPHRSAAGVNGYGHRADGE